MGLLTLLVVLGCAATVARVARMSPAAAVVQATALIILFLYVGALAGMLWWAALAVHVCGAALLGFEALRLARADRIVVPVPIGVLVALAVLFSLAHGDSQYAMYDEYAHWGIFLKEMLALDGFWLADTNSMHPRYPPAATLWQYLFNVLGAPTEGRAYLAQFVLLVTPVLVLWSGLVWRQILWILGTVALVALVIANYGLGVNSLYLDPVIGAWFAGVVLLFMADSDHSSMRRALHSVAPIAVVALLKDVGLAFALAAAATVGMLVFVGTWRDSREVRGAVCRAFLSVLSISGVALLCTQSWSWNRDIAGAAEEVYSVEGIARGLRGEAAEGDAANAAEVARRFSTVVMTQQLSNDAVSWQFNEFSFGIRSLFVDRFRLTTLAAFAWFAVWCTVLIALVRRGADRWTWSVAAACMLATAAGYLLFLHLTYRFAFGGRGVELPSYVRYANTVVLPMVLFAFAPLLPAFAGVGKHAEGSSFSRPKAGLFVAALLTLWFFEFPYLRPLVEGHPRSPVRQELEPVAAVMQEAVGRDKLWIYLPQDSENGFVGRVLQYLLTPARVTLERSTSFFERDHAEVAATWESFDYVWISAALPTEALGRVGGAALHGATHGLFRVVDSGRALMPFEDGHDDPSDPPASDSLSDPTPR